MKTIEEALETCRRRGYRLTPQRVALVETICGRRDHPCAAELLAAVRARFPSTSQATIYNTLDLLERLGIIQTLRTDPERMRFDPETASHAHAWCRWCRKVYDLDAADLGELGVRIAPQGFAVDELELNLRGVCPTCRQS
jgi:Fur family peroxide stress response transcriptional regulator